MRRHYDLKNIYGDSPEVVQSCREYFLRQINVIETILANQDNLINAKLSLADILLVTCLDWAIAYDFKLPENISVYHEKIKLREAYIKAVEINFKNSMGPLEGVKVIDLTSMVSGPLGAMILADQGAEVIKVEPLAGEQMRHMAAPHNGVNPIFYSCNRGKKVFGWLISSPKKVKKYLSVSLRKLMY